MARRSLSLALLLCLAATAFGQLAPHRSIVASGGGTGLCGLSHVSAGTHTFSSLTANIPDGGFAFDTAPQTVPYTASTGDILFIAGSTSAVVGGVPAVATLRAVTDDGGNTWANQATSPPTTSSGANATLWFVSLTAPITQLTLTFQITVAGVGTVDSFVFMDEYTFSPPFTPLLTNSLSVNSQTAAPGAGFGVVGFFFATQTGVGTGVTFTGPSAGVLRHAVSNPGTKAQAPNPAGQAMQLVALVDNFTGSGVVTQTTNQTMDEFDVKYYVCGP